MATLLESRRIGVRIGGHRPESLVALKNAMLEGFFNIVCFITMTPAFNFNLTVLASGVRVTLTPGYYYVAVGLLGCVLGVQKLSRANFNAVNAADV